MTKLDVLNREEFVDRVVKLIECIADNGAAASFAINGSWGCGKSFVLDRLEEQLNLIQSEETAAEKYFIIRYNCWKYDYYEEPLIAIVAALIAEIDEKTSLFPDGQDKRVMLGMLKATIITLLSMLDTMVKVKYGTGVKEAIEIVNNGAKEAIEQYEKEHSFDDYFVFNKLMAKLIELLQELSEEYKIVFLVDELDRCIPEYAVKVLERLHHLTEGDTQIITAIAMDKDQLMTSIKHTFGFTNPEKYLEKFIQFEVVLDCGEISDNILEKYSDYVALFDKDIFKFCESVEDFIREIFMGIDIRTQEQLVKRAMLVHKLLFSDKKDYSFMCMELLLTVMICVYDDESCLHSTKLRYMSFDKMFITGGGVTERSPMFAKAFAEHFEVIDFSRSQRFSDEASVYHLPKEPRLYGAILFMWSRLHDTKQAKVVFQHSVGDVYTPVGENLKDLKKFVDMVGFID